MGLGKLGEKVGGIGRTSKGRGEREEGKREDADFGEGNIWNREVGQKQVKKGKPLQRHFRLVDQLMFG